MSIIFKAPLKIFALILILASNASQWRAAAQEPFGVDDYFKLRRVTELRLSSDGGLFAYAVEHPSLEENEDMRTVYISATDPAAKSILVPEIQQAYDLAWISGTLELAYLLDSGDVPQVYSINVKTKKIRRHTNGRSPVGQYRFAPDGQTLAWTMSAADKRGPAHRNLLRLGENGVVIDSEYASTNDLIDPTFSGVDARTKVEAHTKNVLWVKKVGGDSFSIEVPGQVVDFHWSSDAQRLSVIFVSEDLLKQESSRKYTSIGVVDTNDGELETIANGQPPSETGIARYFTGGEWVPDAAKFVVRRVTERHIWTIRKEWAVLDLAHQHTQRKQNARWRAFDVYPLRSTLIPYNDRTIFVNGIIQAHRSLYELTPSGAARAPMPIDTSDAISLLQFSYDFFTAIYVAENFTSPPEIYLWRKGIGIKKITNLNVEIARKQLPIAREVTWVSGDGTEVQGWLLEPPVGNSAHSNQQPWPLLTFVHGGPFPPMTNEFAYYFKSWGGLWPYPFEVYALNGIAVFLPNYRGTMSFGNAFANPDAPDGDPVEDIVSGITYLVSEGVADARRLAMSGHSHGAWLGSLVMTRTKLFCAASFAEGPLNNMVNYIHASPYLSRYGHDHLWGGRLYDEPQRYIETSADFHFSGLDTALLLEAGINSQAITMMGSFKAASLANMPSEFVVYPRSGHNIRIARLKMEAATRNFDWFRFWLQGYDDPDPDKIDQYARWRKMRDEQCSRLKGSDAPGYCKH